MSKEYECPFCDEPVILQITDDEGNFRNEDYLDDPWSGVGYIPRHDTDNTCPIATHEAETLGKFNYESVEEFEKSWCFDSKGIR